MHSAVLGKIWQMWPQIEPKTSAKYGKQMIFTNKVYWTYKNSKLYTKEKQTCRKESGHGLQNGRSGVTRNRPNFWCLIHILEEGNKSVVNERGIIFNPCSQAPYARCCVLLWFLLASPNPCSSHQQWDALFNCGFSWGHCCKSEAPESFLSIVHGDFFGLWCLVQRIQSVQY